VRLHVLRRRSARARDPLPALRRNPQRALLSRARAAHPGTRQLRELDRVSLRPRGAARLPASRPRFDRHGTAAIDPLLRDSDRAARNRRNEAGTLWRISETAVEDRARVDSDPGASKEEARIRRDA